MKDSRVKAASIYLLCISLCVTLSLRGFVGYARFAEPKYLFSGVFLALCACTVAILAWRGLRR